MKHTHTLITVIIIKDKIILTRKTWWWDFLYGININETCDYETRASKHEHRALLTHEADDTTPSSRKSWLGFLKSKQVECGTSQVSPIHQHTLTGPSQYDDTQQRWWPHTLIDRRCAYNIHFIRSIKQNKILFW